MQKNNILFEISSKATTFVIMAIIVATLAGCTKKDDEIVLNPENTYYLENETENVVYTDTADVTNAVSADNEQDEDTLEKTSSIFVYVCGAVLHEGVYELESGSRVIDAINAAGGFDIEADTSPRSNNIFPQFRIRVPDGISEKINRIFFIQSVAMISRPMIWTDTPVSFFVLENNIFLKIF